jgi:hypothetical protein
MDAYTHHTASAITYEQVGYNERTRKRPTVPFVLETLTSLIRCASTINDKINVELILTDHQICLCHGKFACTSKTHMVPKEVTTVGVPH